MAEAERRHCGDHTPHDEHDWQYVDESEENEFAVHLDDLYIPRREVTFQNAICRGTRDPWR